MKAKTRGKERFIHIYTGSSGSGKTTQILQIARELVSDSGKNSVVVYDEKSEYDELWEIGPVIIEQDFMKYGEDYALKMMEMQMFAHQHSKAIKKNWLIIDDFEKVFPRKKYQLDFIENAKALAKYDTEVLIAIKEIDILEDEIIEVILEHTKEIKHCRSHAGSNKAKIYRCKIEELG